MNNQLGLAGGLDLGLGLGLGFRVCVRVRRLVLGLVLL